jgi:Ni/Co efflux regulator RcnB
MEKAMTKIITTIAATIMLATAVASPALAQYTQAPTQQHEQGGTYHGYPTSEWTRPDSY